MKHINLIFLFLLLIINSIYSQTTVNPFYGNGNKTNIRPKTGNHKILFRDSKFYQTIADWQRTLRNKITDLTLTFKSTKNISIILIILGICFIYGFIHALGPGHRKTVLFSYFLSNEAKPIHGIIAGISLSTLHAGSALALILGLYFFVKSSFLPKKASYELIMEKISYALIVMLGLILLINKIFKIIKKKFTSERKAKQSNKYFLPILLSGLVPCPGASAILIFSITAGFITLGILGVIAMSLGMAVTITIVSIATILGKNELIKATERYKRLNKIAFNGIELTGALILLIFGLIMFLPLIFG